MTLPGGPCTIGPRRRPCYQQDGCPMRKGCSALIVVLTAGMLLVASATQAAQSRPLQKKRQQQPEDAAATREATLSQLDVWLRRLAGRFRADADREWERLADCQSVGEGPAIHCIVGPVEGSEKPYPSVMLLGIAAELPGVRYLRVDESSQAETGLGKLSGDTLVLGEVSSCPASVGTFSRAVIVRCENRLRIHAPPNGRSFSLYYVTDVTFLLPPGRFVTHTLTTERRFERVRDRGRRSE